MKLLDLSQPILDGCPNCPVHPSVRSSVIADHATDDWRMEALAMASHTGSHVDAPLHKIAGGASLDEIPLESFTGPAFIADLRGIVANAPIDGAMLEARLPTDIKDAIILLATGWGDKRAKTDEWLHDSPFLSPDGAQWLVEKGARAVGIDHYSVGGSREPGNANTHTVVLGAGLWIVEELRFPPEVFDLTQPLRFWCLPVNFQGHSGAFCRPVVQVD